MDHSFKGKVWCNAVEADCESGLQLKKSLKIYVARGGDIKAILRSIKAPLRWRQDREDWSRVECNKWWCRPTLAYWRSKRTRVL
jgi:hypothetical protein